MLIACQVRRKRLRIALVVGNVQEPRTDRLEMQGC